MDGRMGEERRVSLGIGVGKLKREKRGSYR